MKRIYIDPKAMSSHFKRNVIKSIAIKYGAEINFQPISTSTYRTKNFESGFFYIDVSEKDLNRLKRLMFRFGIKSVNQEKAVGRFDKAIIAHMKVGLEEGIPIGYSKNRDRLVIIPWPSKIVSNSRLLGLFLALTEEKVIWIGEEFQGYDKVLEVIDGIPIKMVKDEKLMDLASFIAEELFGKFKTVQILEYLKSKPSELLRDEELDLITQEEKSVREFFEMGVLTRGESLNEGRYILDASNLPSTGINIAILTTILAEFPLIIVDNLSFNHKILGYLSNKTAFIYIKKGKDFPPHFDSFIDMGSLRVLKRVNIGSEEHIFIEKFEPLWGIFKEV